VGKLHLENKVPAAGAFSRPVKDVQTPSIDNSDGTITPVAQMVYPIDPNTDPMTLTMPCRINGSTGLQAEVADPLTTLISASLGVVTKSAIFVYPYPNPAQPLRTPTTFRSATVPAATGTTDVWTPAGGKKFRLMGYAIHFSGTAAAAGLRTFSIQEETLGAIGMDTGTLAPAAGTGAENSSLVVNLPGNGYLATTADKKLQVVTATTAYTAGADYITVWGTEE